MADRSAAQRWHGDLVQRRDGFSALSALDRVDRLVVLILTLVPQSSQTNLIATTDLPSSPTLPEHLVGLTDGVLRLRTSVVVGLALWSWNRSWQPELTPGPREQRVVGASSVPGLSNRRKPDAALDHLSK